MGSNGPHNDGFDPKTIIWTPKPHFGGGGAPPPQIHNLLEVLGPPQYKISYKKPDFLDFPGTPLGKSFFWGKNPIFEGFLLLF